jgi:hypothetical protein
MQAIKFLDVLQKLGSIVTLIPCMGEFIRGKGSAAEKSFSNNTLSRAGDGCEEVRGCLSRWTFKPHFDKVFPRRMNLPEINLSSFVQNRDLVEDLQHHIC